jgi:mono/diheme cytochrome c family protein
LADAHAAGRIGPNLDEMKPTVKRVQAAVKRGVGNMPAYEDRLSEKEIADVARYVAAAASNSTD